MSRMVPDLLVGENRANSIYAHQPPKKLNFPPLPHICNVVERSVCSNSIIWSTLHSMGGRGEVKFLGWMMVIKSTEVKFLGE